LFHVHLSGDRATLQARALELARERGLWLFHDLGPTLVPGVHKLELNIGEPALEIPASEAAELFAEILAP
jgi:hypothetical protein